MDKGDIIKVKVSNGVEVKAVILDIIEEDLGGNIWTINYILYDIYYLVCFCVLLLLEK